MLCKFSTKLAFIELINTLGGKISPVLQTEQYWFCVCIYVCYCLAYPNICKGCIVLSLFCRWKPKHKKITLVKSNSKIDLGEREFYLLLLSTDYTLEETIYNC